MIKNKCKGTLRNISEYLLHKSRTFSEMQVSPPTTPCSPSTHFENRKWQTTSFGCCLFPHEEWFDLLQFLLERIWITSKWSNYWVHFAHAVTSKCKSNRTKWTTEEVNKLRCTTSYLFITVHFRFQLYFHFACHSVYEMYYICMCICVCVSACVRCVNVSTYMNSGVFETLTKPVSEWVAV